MNRRIEIGLEALDSPEAFGREVDRLFAQDNTQNPNETPQERERLGRPNSVRRRREAITDRYSRRINGESRENNWKKYGTLALAGVAVGTAIWGIGKLFSSEKTAENANETARTGTFGKIFKVLLGTGLGVATVPIVYQLFKGELDSKEFWDAWDKDGVSGATKWLLDQAKAGYIDIFGGKWAAVAAALNLSKEDVEEKINERIDDARDASNDVADEARRRAREAQDRITGDDNVEGDSNETDPDTTNADQGDTPEVVGDGYSPTPEGTTFDEYLDKYVDVSKEDYDKRTEYFAAKIEDRANRFLYRSLRAYFWDHENNMRPDFNLQDALKNLITLENEHDLSYTTSAKQFGELLFFDNLLTDLAPDLLSNALTTGYTTAYNYGESLIDFLLSAGGVGDSSDDSLTTVWNYAKTVFWGAVIMMTIEQRYGVIEMVDGKKVVRRVKFGEAFNRNFKSFGAIRNLNAFRPIHWHNILRLAGVPPAMILDASKLDFAERWRKYASLFVDAVKETPGRMANTFRAADIIRGRTERGKSLNAVIDDLKNKMNDTQRVDYFREADQKLTDDYSKMENDIRAIEERASRENWTERKKSIEINKIKMEMRHKFAEAYFIKTEFVRTAPLSSLTESGEVRECYKLNPDILRALGMMHRVQPGMELKEGLIISADQARKLNSSGVLGHLSDMRADRAAENQQRTELRTEVEQRVQEHRENFRSDASLERSEVEWGMADAEARNQYLADLDAKAERLINEMNSELDKIESEHRTGISRISRQESKLKIEVQNAYLPLIREVYQRRVDFTFKFEKIRSVSADGRIERHISFSEMKTKLDNKLLAMLGINLEVPEGVRVDVDSIRADNALRIDIDGIRARLESPSRFRLRR